MKAFRKALAIIIPLMLLGYGVLVTAYSCASRKTLENIRSIKPGEDIAEVRLRFGAPNTPGSVMAWGSIKDTQFCADKNLYRFYVLGPPCRAVEVYTDKNNKVVFVTWSGL